MPELDVNDVTTLLEQPAQRRLPFAFARRHGVLLLERGGELRLGLREGAALTAVQEAQRVVGMRLPMQWLAQADFDQALGAAYQHDSSAAMLMVEGLGNDLDLASLAELTPESGDLLEQEDDAPIIRLINAILSEAIAENASDIHIETFEKRLVIRFRVDGILREVVQPKRELAALLVSRIKVMAKLDIAEKRVPQDGRIKLNLSKTKQIDFRVSTLPTLFGEKVVLRILDASAAKLGIDKLGYEPDQQALFLEAIHKPYGMVLVTGPTGSGKSTTLAAMLDYLNNNKYHHILTIEDPIEFVHESKKCLVNQREVHRDTHGFSEALRSALREDPDIILVGEMRDLETIRLALTAAETGHLVFGTLHTSSAAKTIDRIIDVFPAGEKPMVRSMLSESLRAVISQALLKKVGGGRTAAWEIMVGTPAIRNLIREDKVAQMYSAIQTGGSLGMQTLDMCLKALLAKGLISRDSAREKAKQPENF